MKICHVIYTPRLSGAEILVRDLAFSHVSLGHQILISSIEPPEISFLKQIEQLQAAGVILAFPKNQLGKLARLQFLSNKLKKFVPDVVIGHSVIPSIYARVALKFTALRHIPMMSVLHDASQDDYGSRYFRYSEWLLPSPNCVITVTRTAADNYQKRIGKSVKNVIIPNGINLEKLVNANIQRGQIRQSVFGAKNTETIFLQVGRCNSIKQQHLTLQAFIRCCQNPSFSGKLFFVGLVEDINLEKKLRQITADSKLEDRIIFLGPRTDVPELLAGADVYLMPSQREAHSVAFLEALASGINIIGSDIPPFQFGLEFPGVTLIQPENIDVFTQKILEAASEGEIRPQRDMSHYSIEKTANAYLDVINVLKAESKL